MNPRKTILLCITISGFLLAGALTFAGDLSWSRGSGKKIAEAVLMPGDISRVKMTAQEIYEKYAPAVALITTTWETPATSENIQQIPPGQRKSVQDQLSRGEEVLLKSAATGSGVAVARMGDYQYFLTNCHVVDIKQELPYPAPIIPHSIPYEISVAEYIGKSSGLTPDISRLLEGSPPGIASAVGSLLEAHPGIDICVLSTGGMEWSFEQSLRTGSGGRDNDLALVQPVRGIRSFADLNVGENVFVIGNPTIGGNTLSWSLTRGIISALHPNYRLGNITADMIQIDAPITHGNSGGALFDEYGNLIGLPQSTYETTQGFSFAVSAELVWLRYGKTGLEPKPNPFPAPDQKSWTNPFR